MSITPLQLDLYTSNIVDIYRALEVEIFEQIAKRLKVKGNVNILDWQVEKLAQLNMLNRSTLKELSKVSGRSVEEIKKIISEAGYGATRDVDKQLEKVFDPKPLPNDLDHVLTGYFNQTWLEMDNLVNQTLLTTQYGKGSVARLYESIINETTAKVLSGVQTHQKALEETILKWADKGIDSGFVDKGGHTWSLERYVDTVLRSTVNNTYNKMTTSRMAEYDVYTVIMTSVVDAAPRCASCQGRVLDIRPVSQADSGYPSIYEFGYGRAGGTLGINTNNQPQYDNEKIEKRYKMRQAQRAIERRIRKTKKNIVITEALGSDKLDHYTKLLKAQQLQMRELLKKADASELSRNYKREKVVTPKETILKEVNKS